MRKRGPSPGGDRYYAKRSDLKLTMEQANLVNRRTRPFLDSFGMERSLETLLGEAYLQGMADAIQEMEIKK